MRLGPTTAGPATITAVLGTMEGRVIRITATIRPRRLRPMDITRIHTTGVIQIPITAIIPAITLTTVLAISMTMQQLPLCSAG